MQNVDPRLDERKGDNKYWIKAPLGSGLRPSHKPKLWNFFRGCTKHGVTSHWFEKCGASTLRFVKSGAPCPRFKPWTTCTGRAADMSAINKLQVGHLLPVNHLSSKAATISWHYRRIGRCISLKCCFCS